MGSLCSPTTRIKKCVKIGKSRNATTAVIRLKIKWATATSFLSGIPPIAPRIAVTVVPMLVPMTIAADCSKLSICTYNALKTIAVAAELDWIRAVITKPIPTNAISGKFENLARSIVPAKDSMAVFMISRPKNKRPNPTSTLASALTLLCEVAKMSNNPPAPIIGSAKASILTLNPRVATIHAVTVVPTFEPKITAIPEYNEIKEALTNDSVINVTTEEL